ncbi:MAG: 2-keto-4-pentenoate hydratase [Betaproteobacteria bacterium]
MLLAAHSTHTQFASAQADAPKDIGEVYRIHDAVYAGLAQGAPPVAWKVGGPSADVEPSIAPVLPGRVFASPATLRAADFHIIGVEAEIAFQLRNHNWELRVAIELCDARLSDWKSAPPLMKLADNQMNWGLVLGSGIADWDRIDFAAQPAELWVGGKQVVSMTGGHPYGNPFRLVEWTRRHLAARTAEVREGDVITTGSWGGMHFAAPGDEIVARFSGIGEAAARIS